MNCADYRRLLATDPAHLDAACEQHRAQCTECAALTQRARDIEQRLRQALAIEPPADLQHKLLQTIAHDAGQIMQPASPRHAARARWMPAVGIAASVLLAVLAGAGTWSMRVQHDMPQLAVAHMMGEEAAVLKRKVPISEEAVVAGFRGRQIALRQAPPAGITYVHDCVVGDYRGVHVAMRRDDETVTVLYLLGTRRKAGDYQQGDMHVRMRPDARGTLVLLARNPTPFDAVERDWQSVLDSARTIPASAS